MTSIIDSHCHLDYFGHDTDEVVDRAKRAGVGKMVTVSTKIAEFAQIKAIAAKYPEVLCSVGTHPHNAKEEQTITTDDIIGLTDFGKVVAIGESGLDYHYENSPREIQAVVFRRHIGAARITGLPLIIHARSADDDMIAILTEEYQERGAFTAILHCFSSGLKLAELGVKLQFALSFSGILTFKNSAELREIARYLPKSALLIETDAPYLAPTPYRGKRNEPGFIVKTAEQLAKIRDTSFEEIIEQTFINFDHFFPKAAGV